MTSSLLIMYLCLNECILCIRLIMDSTVWMFEFCSWVDVRWPWSNVLIIIKKNMNLSVIIVMVTPLANPVLISLGCTLFIGLCLSYQCDLVSIIASRNYALFSSCLISLYFILKLLFLYLNHLHDWWDQWPVQNLI